MTLKPNIETFLLDEARDRSREWFHEEIKKGIRPMTKHTPETSLPLAKQFLSHAFQVVIDCEDEIARLRTALQKITDLAYAKEHDEIVRISDMYECAKEALSAVR